MILKVIMGLRELKKTHNPPRILSSLEVPTAALNFE